MAASAKSMKTKKTFGQWFKSRKVQQWLVIVSFMIVPVLLLLVFSYVPFAKMFEFSLYKMKSYDSKNNTYVGFKNYIDVFTRDDCFNSLKLAGYYIVASFIQLAMALYFATILCFKVRGSSLFKGLIFFPYLISGQNKDSGIIQDSGDRRHFIFLWFYDLFWYYSCYPCFMVYV